MVDYFPKYLTPSEFDLPRLINDDFFAAIKLLFNAGHYVSASKLLMSFIDSIAFVEYGDCGGGAHFCRWLDTFVNLKPLRITAGELWEHRNSLLHMTNLDSRKVLAGKVRRLLFYVGTLPAGAPCEDAEAKFYDLFGLIQAVASGLAPFCQSYNADRSKFEVFVSRYDLLVSDHRMLRLKVGSESGAG